MGQDKLEKHENCDAQDEQKEELNEEQKKDLKKSRLVWFLLLVIVLAVFCVIVLFTDFLGNQFGKTAENMVLTVIAVILAVLLYISHKQK